MARSLLRQLEQIRRSATYDDQVAGVNTAPVAEPTVSGSLEEDLNVIRTISRQTKGTTDWYTDLAQYFDPTNTTSGSAELKDLNILNFKNNTLDAKTVILAVNDDNSGAGYTVSGTSTGILILTDTAYGTATVRPGLPIFASTANPGSYWDEGGADRVVRVDIINDLTAAEMQDTSGNVIYSKLHDGADFSGTGDGTDVYARFYANGNPVDLTSVTGTIGTLTVIYPQRKVMANMEEYDWQRTDFISSWEGDVELIEDIMNLWLYTGSGDGVSSTAGSWTNTTGTFPFAGDPSDLQLAVDTLNTDAGDMDWTALNYPIVGDDLAEAITALDTQVKINADAAGGAGNKYIEEAAGLITAGTFHPLPNSLTYTPDATAGQEGKNMDVYIAGQLLAADTGVSGINADRDYGETAVSGIVFRFDIQAAENIVYTIRS